MGRTSAWFADPDGNLINTYRPTEPIDPVEAVRGYFRRLFDGRDPGACDQLSPGYVDHDSPAGTAPGTAATRAYVTAMVQEDPQLRVEILAAVSQGTTVAARIRWIPGPLTGRGQTDGLVLIEVDEQGRLRERSSVYTTVESPDSSRSTTGAS
ncbi:nuclear transport factor 2 family protein [Microlunatus speluncae]|uniref:nuclear transport factor 2 family protein n=1 Tax=Microlunatus speluncae TaxID=2594267 RepID=UPI001375F539|nr:nuclear transport factor 2 family protein [Microlunatus speluncae]